MVPPPASNLTSVERLQLPFEVSPDPLELGSVRNGESARATVTMTNRVSGPLTLDRVETSCPCMHATGTPVTVGAGETASLDVSFDPSDEPGFEGGLSVDVTGLHATGKTLFKTTVNVRVNVDQQRKANEEDGP